MATGGKFNWLTFAYGMVLTGFMVISCAEVSKAPLPNPTTQISDAMATTKTVQSGMGTIATNIDNHVIAVRKATPVAAIPQVAPHLDGINTETAKLRSLETQLTSVQSDLLLANTQVVTLQGAISSLQSENKKLVNQVTALTAQLKNALHNLLIWVAIFSVVGVGVAAALVFEGNTWGISLGFGCLVTLGLSIFITQYAVWFAISSGVLCLGGLGYIIYQRFATKTVSTQLAKTVEAAKMGMPDYARLAIFGNGPICGNVHMIQSERTQRFVENLRKSNKITLAPSVKPVNLTQDTNIKV